VPLSRSLKEISIEELKSLADERPLSHLAIEFGVSDKALSKRLQKAGWISPRAKMRAMR
jgi:Zn-dependent peptidase ImmA (M78 family)